MAQKDRKNQSKRGTRSCGYGNTQKHRGAGSRGGHGMAGSKKHKWMHVSKFMPGYFGGKGFKRHTNILFETEAINVGDLCRQIPLLVAAKHAEKTGDKIRINLTDLGYGKLLGSGAVTQKIEVTVNAASAKAVEKVEAAGGSVTVLSPTEKADSAEETS
ncbi:50S ribosomal protein L15 [uncultured archaeon]|nr:50S ribosomal protein L15 [uncultured archaeon]